jgi:hypothetical protein
MYSLFLLYQKTFWYIQQFGSELSKPMRFYYEFTLLILLLDKYDVKLTVMFLIVTYCCVLVVAAIGGWVLTRMGVVAYNTKLANKQNEEIQLILQKLNRIEKRLK